MLTNQEKELLAHFGELVHKEGTYSIPAVLEETPWRYLMTTDTECLLTEEEFLALKASFRSKLDLLVELHNRGFLHIPK